MNVIEIENVSKVYKLYHSPIDRLKESLSLNKKIYHKDFYALENVSLDIKCGEAVGIIGLNGSGKSTLLKIITNVLTATTGHVNINGRISALLELGSGFNPEYTGIENIYFQGNLFGYTSNEIDKRLDSILDFADIGEFIHQPVKTYSSGMFARLAFAVSINVEPDILIVDEALSVGDASFQNKCMRKMEEIVKKGITVLVVSHDAQFINKFCNRVIWLHKGKIKEYGLPKKVLENYLSYSSYGIETIRDNKVEKILQNIGLIDVTTCDSFGIKKALINKVQFLNKNNEPTLYLKQGEIAIFICEFSTEIDLHKVGIGVIFKNVLNNEIITFNSYMYNKTLDFVKAGSSIRTKIYFRVPKIYPKEYMITVALSEGTMQNHIQQHWIHNAMTINITSSDMVDACILTLYQDEVRYEYEQI